MNKKGFSIGLLDHIAFFIIIIVPFLMIYFFFLANISNAIEDSAAGIFPDLETQIYQNRLLNSENCFAYQNDAGRVIAGTIDPNKLAEERFRACLPLLTAQERGVEILIDLENETKIFRTDNVNQLRQRQVIEVNLVPVNVHEQRPTVMRITHLR
ncbi:MAG: hypothetical protein ACMXX9_01890 [Candidatus Woesearchaeota archaeon]